MGLDAYVRCTCWEEGKTSPPPVPRARVVLNPESDELDLDLPWEGHREAHAAFQDWLETCCPHSRMQLASERISSWAGVRHFQAALRTLGADRFKTLLAAIPDTNSGRTDARDAKACLEELGRFEAQGPFGRRIHLTDAESGEVLHDYVEDYGGVFAWLGREGIEMGVDPEGFFVTDREGTEFFRAKVFEQKREEQAFTLRDLESGAKFLSPAGLSYPGADGVTDVYPRQLKVVIEHETPKTYENEVKALKSVFGASVKTGRPVIWC